MRLVCSAAAPPDELFGRTVADWDEPLVDLEQLVEPLIDEKFLDGIARTGEYSVLTEAKLDELEMKREKMPEDYVRISQTLTWWADRQKSMQRRLEERKRLQERRLAGACLEHGR